MDDTDVTGDFRSQFLVEKCAFEFRSIDFGRSNTIGWNEHFCVFCDLIGSRRWKRVRHFLCMKTIPFTRQSKQLWAEWSCEKLAMSSSKRPRLCTEYYRKTKGSSSDTQSSSASKESTFFGTWSNWNGHVCFLRKRFVTADLNGLQAPVLLFCFNRERQTAKEM